MRNPTTLLKSASLKLTALFYLMGLLVLPSTAAAWNYQLRYMVPADAGVDEYRIYLELGSSGYQFYTQVQGPLAPYAVHTYDLVGLPDDQDVSIVMTSCRFDDGVPVESIHSNELFFPVDPSCVDADCDDGNPCTLDYCLNDACSYDAAAMDGQLCDDGDAGNDPDSCSDGICTGTPVTIFGVTALSGISDGATVSGELYIEALVSAGTESVRFYLDGAEYRVESAPPYGFNSDNGPGALIPWDTASVANGLHSITATGYDQDGGAGQAGTSVSVSFNVQNTTPDCIDDTDCADGDLCNGDERCDLDVCRPGTALTCLDPGQCQVASCDATLGCVVYALANGAACDDGDAGTHSDVCIFGSCAGTTAECFSNGDCSDGDVCNGDESCSNYTCLPGTTLSCADPGQCQVASCDATLGCVAQNLANGTTCNDGNPASLGDSCQSGTCVGVVPGPLQVTDLVSSLPSPQPAGTTITYTALTDGGSGQLEYRWVVKYGTSAWVYLTPGFSPSPSYSWTPQLPGSYKFGVHVQSVGQQDVVYYSEDFTATEAPPVQCTIDVHCADGDACNGDEWCNNGACLPGTALSCPAAGQCQVASCDAALGCLTQNLANGTSCNDGDPGTHSDSCTNGSCTGIPAECSVDADCDDGIACTVDVCNQSTLSCVRTANHGSCDNGLFCDGAESCDLALGCQAGTPPAVDDGVGCTVDACNESTDSIVHAPNHGSCSNGLFCDGAETCNVALGCQAGTAPNASDGVSCTIDTCNESTDSFVHTPSNGSCSNGLFCDGTETCNATLGCQAGTPPVVNDGIACTVDSCDEAADRVVHTPNNSVCSNGQFCDGTEVCNRILGCQVGTPPVIDDGITCTVDWCDETANTVVHDDDQCGGGPIVVQGFSSSPNTTQPAGVTRVITVTTSGGNGNLEYDWYVRFADNSWVSLGPAGFGSSPSVSWIPAKAGTYTIGVHVRNVGEQDTVYYSELFSATAPLPIVVQPFLWSPSRDAPVNVERVITAQVSGGSGNLEYSWHVKYGAYPWVELRGYSSSPSISWTPTLPGSYKFGLWVRSVGAQDELYYSEFPIVGY